MNKAAKKTLVGLLTRLKETFQKERGKWVGEMVMWDCYEPTWGFPYVGRVDEVYVEFWDVEHCCTHSFLEEFVEGKLPLSFILEAVAKGKVHYPNSESWLETCVDELEGQIRAWMKGEDIELGVRCVHGEFTHVNPQNCKLVTPIEAQSLLLRAMKHLA